MSVYRLIYYTWENRLRIRKNRPQYDMGTAQSVVFLSHKYLIIIHPDKKRKATVRFSPLSFPFNAKMLIVIKYLVLIKSRQNSSVALMSIFAFHVKERNKTRQDER